jgi:hypothetical protein
MRKALFTTAVALGVAIASYAMMQPSALATTPNTCAILASSFSPYGPVQINAPDQLHQMIESKIYAACLQTRGKQGASRMTAPGQAGTKNTTNAGAFVTFDVPGTTFTNPLAINNPGAVTGSYSGVLGDVGLSIHSFLRTSDGTITPFDPPGATSIGSTFGSIPSGITPDGTIVGRYNGTGDLIHGYLRAANGTITVFDPPGSRLTFPAAINPAGTTVGFFFTADNSAHGFLRAPNGTITVFDPPGSFLTGPTAISPTGTVTGSFIPPDFSATHGFVARAKDIR